MVKTKTTTEVLVIDASVCSKLKQVKKVQAIVSYSWFTRLKIINNFKTLLCEKNIKKENKKIKQLVWKKFRLFKVNSKLMFNVDFYKNLDHGLLKDKLDNREITMSISEKFSKYRDELYLGSELFDAAMNRYFYEDDYDLLRYYRKRRYTYEELLDILPIRNKRRYKVQRVFKKKLTPARIETYYYC